MAARALLVHAGCSNRAVVLPDAQHLKDLGNACHKNLLLPVDEDALCAVLAHFEVVATRVEQVSDAFEIDLKIGRANLELDVLRRPLNPRKYLVHDPGNHPTHLGVVDVGALHCERFSGACLAVGKDCGVVAFEQIGDCGADLFVDIRLRARPRVNAVECEFAARSGEKWVECDRNSKIKKKKRKKIPCAL